MRMYATIKFDREITEEHYIVPGSFTVMAGGKEYSFDFHDTDCAIDPKHPDTLYYRGKDEDLEAFPETSELQERLSEIDNVVDFYIFTGEDDEPKIYPVKLLDCVIEAGGKGKAPKFKNQRRLQFDCQDGDCWNIRFEFPQKLLHQVSSMWKEEAKRQQAQ